jgi:hypothetical protein
MDHSVSKKILNSDPTLASSFGVWRHFGCEVVRFVAVNAFYTFIPQKWKKRMLAFTLSVENGKD